MPHLNLDEMSEHELEEEFAPSLAKTLRTAITKPTSELIRWWRDTKARGYAPDYWLTRSEATTRLHEAMEGARTEAYCKKLMQDLPIKGRLQNNGERGKNLRINPDAVDALALRMRRADIERDSPDLQW